MSVFDRATIWLQASTYGGSGDWVDLSGNGHDATPINSPTHDGTKFTLNGSSQYFRITDHNDLDFGTSDSFTGIAVAAPDAANPGGLNYLFGKGFENYACSLRPGTTVRSIIYDGTTYIWDDYGSAPVSDGVIASFALRRDATANEVEAFVNGAGTGTPTTDTSTATLANATALTLGARVDPLYYFDGGYYGFALFREALSDNDIYTVGRMLELGTVQDPRLLHGDALFTWILENESLTVTDTELVGALNELNGTNGVEYAQARATYLGVDPAG